MNRVTTLLSFGGDQKTNDNQNVYHSLQLTKGIYKLTFRSEGDAGQTIGVKIRELPSNTIIYESTVNVNVPATLFFTTDSSWSEYKLLLTRKKTATITVKDIRIDASSDEEAAGISELTSSQQLDGACYSLNGLRISQPSKGLYIKNGRKFVVGK